MDAVHATAGVELELIREHALAPEEIASAIQNEDVKTIQGIKGIGAKTAQRVIVDLKDKMLKMNFSTKQISELKGTSENSVDVARSRLRQKLGMQDRNIDLCTYLNGFY